MEIDKENVVQAVVIMDTFNNNFHPICKNRPMGLLPVAGVPLLDYILESLALGGVGETILFCCQDGVKIKEHIKLCLEKRSIWTLTMDVQVLISDTCQTMGDVMRELDAAAIIKGYFVLASVNSITNINFATFLDQHKQTCKKDKGAAMTLVYKKVSWEHPLISFDKPIFLAADANTKKVLIHQRYKPKSSEKSVSIPLEVILNHSEVKLHHNLIDANIALCSPTVPPLFSDNFDFQTRDDFIHGILINEDILASSLYYTLLKPNQYAATITNWKTYQTICRDIMHMWVHPLSIETGSFSQTNYHYMGNHNSRHKDAVVNRSSKMVEGVLIGARTRINNTNTIVNSVIGQDCVIGNLVTIIGSHIMNDVVIKDNSRVINSFVGDNCVIKENSTVTGGSMIATNVTVGNFVTVVGSHIMNNVVIQDNCRIINSDLSDNTVIPPNSNIIGRSSIAANITGDAGTKLNENIKENSEFDTEKKLLKSTSENSTEWENESSGLGDDEFIGFEKTWSDSKSYYSSDSSAESSLPDSPVPDDSNIFLQEVVDSLARGYDEKLKCDYLILEINSSRYAYNMQLHEVNFFVVKALLSIPVLSETNNVLVTVKDILKYFRPVLANYVKTKTSIIDCLKAVEDSCIKSTHLEGKCGQIVHLLYEADVVDEDSLLEWYEDLKENESVVLKQPTLVKFFEWLQQASEESEESD